MRKILLFIFTITTFLPLSSCQKTKLKSLEIDNRSYIKQFEFIQKNSSNDTEINIKSPKAIIDKNNNDIEIFDSSIEIITPSGMDFKITALNSTLNNYNNLIRIYDNVNIYLTENINSYIKTNSLDWDLNTSNINLNSPLLINFFNTTIIASDGFYDIESGKLKLNNNIFNRNVINKERDPIYQIKIVADNVNWFKKNNLFEFTSNEKQVETTIKFLGIK